MRFYLDVRQVEALERFEPPAEFPPLVWSPTFIEFNGRIKYDYPQDVEVFSDFDDLTYRAIYIGVAGVDMIVPQPEVTNFSGRLIYEAYWFQPTSDLKSRISKGQRFPSVILELVQEEWLDAPYFPGIDPKEKHYLEKLLKVTRNLLWFLAAENQVWVKITPAVRELHQKDLRGLPKSKEPYYVIPYQLPRYHYLVQKSSGNGARLGHRFDVRGHLRHLVHPRFHRDADGAPRVVWITGHQRGLDSEVYVPALRTGTIDRRILEYDQFFKERESRDRAQPQPV
jgi:hypothetical protein